jgi:Flp pilus assembly protein TadG
MVETAKTSGGGSVGIAVKNRSPHRRSDRQRGAVLVEFAIAAILLMTLLFGIISYGYVLSFKQGITQAAAEGARAGAVGNDVSAAVARSVGAFNRTCNAGGLTCKSDTAAWPPVAYTCGTGHTCITVTVSYDWKNYPLLPKFPGLSLLLPDTLKSTSVTQVS